MSLGEVCVSGLHLAVTQVELAMGRIIFWATGEVPTDVTLRPGDIVTIRGGDGIEVAKYRLPSVDGGNKKRKVPKGVYITMDFGLRFHDFKGAAAL